VEAFWQSLIEVVLPYVADLLLPLLADLIVLVVVALFGVIGVPLIKWWKNWKVDQWVKDTIIDGVLYAQEKYWDKAGEDKFQYAKAHILSRMNDWGIEISESRIDERIDSAVKRMKKEFGKYWYSDPPKK